ncbi:MAG TPA: ATP-binding cassette domain-containing protein [Desulfobacteraceae bacterium]|nr:ATP-binding cassette domain-containing protein [Desulfobacteraceae bacterium]
MSLYAINALKKRYETRVVLDIPQLSIEEGSIYALLGANGAGKTTLLNLLAFMDVPTSGEIYFRSSLVRFIEKELRVLRRQVVMVDQHPILFTKSVFKNLEFGLKIRGIAKSERAYRIEEALDLVGMRQFMDTPAVNLSGGESQRVALARVLALKPSVLLCDEPTSNVDAVNQTIIIDLLKQLNKTKRMSIIFTSHNSNLASNLAHHTIQLDQGQLIDARKENLFPVFLRRDSNGRFLCSLHTDLTLALSCENQKLTVYKRVLASINPWFIVLISYDEKLPECNVLRGVIRKIELENENIHVVVEAGLFFSLLMTKKKYMESKILVGKEIMFHIPPDKIKVLTVRQ